MFGKKLVSVFAAFMCAFAMCAYSGRPDTTDVEKPRVGILSGPSGIPMAHMIENHSDEYSFQLFASAQTELPSLIKGELDIGFLPPNVAAKVYNTNGGALLMCAVTGNGMLYLISADPEIKTAKDIQGKTVAVAGQGATPDYLSRMIFGDSLTPDFSIPNATIPSYVASGKVSAAIVPEPFATVATKANPEVRRVVNLQKEYGRTGGPEDYPMTVMVVSKTFAKENPKAVRSFMDAYKKSSQWTVANPKKASLLVEKHELGLKAPVVEAAIPNCAFVFKDAKSSRKEVEALLNVFLKFEGTSIGGKLPDSQFYFE